MNTVEPCWKQASFVLNPSPKVVFLREDTGISQTARSHLTNEIRGVLTLLSNLNGLKLMHVNVCMFDHRKI